MFPLRRRCCKRRPLLVLRRHCHFHHLTTLHGLLCSRVFEHRLGLRKRRRRSQRFGWGLFDGCSHRWRRHGRRRLGLGGRGGWLRKIWFGWREGFRNRLWGGTDLLESRNQSYLNRWRGVLECGRTWNIGQGGKNRRMKNGATQGAQEKNPIVHMGRGIFKRGVHDLLRCNNV